MKTITIYRDDELEVDELTLAQEIQLATLNESMRSATMPYPPYYTIINGELTLIRIF